MAVYAIADLHLSFGADKPMDVFSGWNDHAQRLEKNWRTLVEEGDTVILPGDISWGMSLEQAGADFAFIHRLPGRKILLKGNHDYWWTTAAKFYKFCAEQGFSNMEILHNNCHFYGDIALCGTRGWFYEEDRGGTHDEKVFRRELGRLETSLKAAGKREKLCFLHYPPRYQGYECPEILELLERYGVRRCYYGHLHAESHRLALQGNWHGIEFQLVSADYVNFRPVKILD